MSYYKSRPFLGCVTTSDHYNTLLGFFCPFLCPPAPIQGPLWWCWSSACPFPRHIQAAFPFLQVNVIHTANPMEHASHIAAQPQFVHPEHRSFIDLSGHNLANPHPFAGRTVLPCPDSFCKLSTRFPPGSEQSLASPAFIPQNIRKRAQTTRQGTKPLH